MQLFYRIGLLEKCAFIFATDTFAPWPEHLYIDWNRCCVWYIPSLVRGKSEGNPDRIWDQQSTANGTSRDSSNCTFSRQPKTFHIRDILTYPYISIKVKWRVKLVSQWVQGSVRRAKNWVLLYKSWSTWENTSKKTKIHGAGGRTDTANLRGSITNNRSRRHKFIYKPNGHKSVRKPWKPVVI